MGSALHHSVEDNLDAGVASAHADRPGAPKIAGPASLIVERGCGRRADHRSVAEHRVLDGPRLRLPIERHGESSASAAGDVAGEVPCVDGTSASVAVRIEQFSALAVSLGGQCGSGDEYSSVAEESCSVEVTPTSEGRPRGPGIGRRLVDLRGVVGPNLMTAGVGRYVEFCITAKSSRSWSMFASARSFNPSNHFGRAYQQS